MVVVVALPAPLILWPIVGIVGSLLGGIGYGFFATFEAVGENVPDKCYHCFVDGCLSTIRGSWTAVQDFTDFCFHSYFSYMDELSEKVPEDEKPVDISPFMLYQGWKRLLEDLIGREGPFLETVCVPFAGLAILLWPLAVVGAVTAAVISSFFLGLYAGVIVHQEDSLLMGLAYIVSVVSMFDEYVNDLLYLSEGSCLPRPRYRRSMKPNRVKKKLGDNENDDLKIRRESSLETKLISERSRSLKWGIQRYKPVQVWDWLFKSCEVNGRILLRDGLIGIKDIEECIVKGHCKKLSIKLPAWSIVQCLLASAKSNSSGLVISDDLELTKSNSPREKMFEWFFGPLLIMKEQIKQLQLGGNEETCLRELIMCGKNEKPEDWDDSCFLSSDNVRKAQLQAIIRRLQGIVASMSRVPTFRRRFRNLVKMLYIEALQADASANHIGEIPKSRYNTDSLVRGGGGEGDGDKEGRDEIVNVNVLSANKEKHDIADIV
ncbi:hypothetical protein Ddye_015273 [Dipteronia dyeriana]|uniref:Uncharacterized protein n=1 Tax=Dipteronia dyeriana TaxID=168575 RepID=A0AAD9U547_9ROSI|nr:hypothetical protein Ddye_015273 [Dipteronia dyeriana]